jgi:hypothetical protein
MYPAAVACKPRDRRIGTRAYQEGEANGEYPVAAIVDEVMLPALPGAKKKHMVLPKWQVRAMDACVSFILPLLAMTQLRLLALRRSTLCCPSGRCVQ